MEHGPMTSGEDPMGSLSEIERMLVNDYGLGEDSVGAQQELPDPTPTKHVHDITR